MTNKLIIGNSILFITPEEAPQTRNRDYEKTLIYLLVDQIILGKSTNVSSDIKVTDSKSGFRTFAKYIKDAFRFNINRIAIESKMLGNFGRYDLKIKEVKIGVKKYNLGCSTKNHIKHELDILLRILRNIEFNRSLYYFTISGIALGTNGIYLNLIFLHFFALGEIFDFGRAVLMILLNLVGISTAFTEIMLHLIAGIVIEMKNINRLLEHFHKCFSKATFWG